MHKLCQVRRQECVDLFQIVFYDLSAVLQQLQTDSGKNVDWEFTDFVVVGYGGWPADEKVAWSVKEEGDGGSTKDDFEELLEII